MNHYSIIYITFAEGGAWNEIVIHSHSIRSLQQKCLSQKKEKIDPAHRVNLFNIFHAAAILFPDGFIWDAILSEWCTLRERGLPRCLYNDEYWNIKVKMFFLGGGLTNES